MVSLIYVLDSFEDTIAELLARFKSLPKVILVTAVISPPTVKSSDVVNCSAVIVPLALILPEAVIWPLVPSVHKYPDIFNPVS